MTHSLPCDPANDTDGGPKVIALLAIERARMDGRLDDEEVAALTPLVNFLRSTVPIPRPSGERNRWYHGRERLILGGTIAAIQIADLLVRGSHWASWMILGGAIVLMGEKERPRS